MPLPRNRPVHVGRMSPDMIPYAVRTRRRMLIRTERFLRRLEAMGLDREQRDAALFYAEQVAQTTTSTLIAVMDEIEETVARTGSLPPLVQEAA